jgi:hypothetical protein
VHEEAREDPTGDGSVEGVVEQLTKARKIVDTLGRRWLGDAAGGIPDGKVTYCLRKTPDNVDIQGNTGGLSGPFAPEKVGGVRNEGDDLIRRDGDKLGEEIVFASEVRHRGDPAETVAIAHAPEPGRQPGRHQILVGKIGGRGIDDGGPGGRWRPRSGMALSAAGRSRELLCR